MPQPTGEKARVRLHNGQSWSFFWGKAEYKTCSPTCQTAPNEGATNSHSPSTSLPLPALTPPFKHLFHRPPVKIKQASSDLSKTEAAKRLVDEFSLGPVER